MEYHVAINSIFNVYITMGFNNELAFVMVCSLFQSNP